ncbi:MAG: ECF transporter S component [Clostridia bacterium]|nr:ECF transporter S component [Clostridia bacterium]
MSTKTKNSNRKRIVNMTITALLTAIIAVMAFTPIGFLRIGPLELTLIMIPVIIGAVTQGKAAGAFLGAVFGIVSFIQCFTGSALGAILVSESIFKCFIVCFIPRVLTGFLCGLIYSVCAKRDKKQSWSLLVAGISGSLLNTVLFLSALALLFMNVTFTPEQAASLGGLDTVLNTVVAIAAGINAPIELIVCAILGTAIGKAVHTATKKLN